MKNQKKIAKSLKNNNFFLVISLILVLFFVSLVIVKDNDTKARKAFLEEASLITSFLEKENLSLFLSDMSNAQSFYYKQFKQRLYNIRSSSKSFKFLYLIAQKKNGKVFFIIDSQKNDSKDFVSYGVSYSEISDEYLEVFKTKKEAIVGPVTDRWGTIITALIPVKDKNGKLVAVLGLDIIANNWYKSIVTQSIPLIASIWVIVLLGFIITSQIKKAKRKLQESEDTYRNIFNNAQVGLFRTRIEDGKILEANENIAKMTGYDTREEFIENYVPSESYVDEGVREKMVQEIQSKGYVDKFEARFYNRNRDIVWTSYSARVFPEKGWIEGVLEIITERKNIELDLKSALKKATESDRLKTAFLHNMSHEVRTPMNGILGFSQLLKTPGLSSDDQENYIKLIEESSDRLLNTITDLLNISLIESEQVKVSISNTNINELNKELFSFFKPEVEKNGMKLFLKSTLPTYKAIVKTDGTKLSGILTILIRNAIKFSTKGSIAFGCIEKNNSLEFYVKDDGIGIPKNRQKAIFERFVQADIEDENVFEGSGLGLSIAKAYVEILGGKIWVESEEGSGTQFFFTIPQIIENKEEIAEEIKTETIIEKEKKRLKVLIVEDDDFSKMHIDIIMKKISSEILHATNGIEAIELCKQNPDIDLILMDIRLPRMNGYEATQEIRKFNKSVFIIAETAYALVGERQKAENAGCDKYISKPIKKENLLSIIAKKFDI